MDALFSPLELPGAIQPHGFLLGVGEESGEVRYASANVEPFLAMGVSEVLGQPIWVVLGPMGRAAWQAALDDPAAALLPVHFRRMSLAGAGARVRDCDLIVHRRGGLVMIEGEWADDSVSRLTRNFSNEVGQLHLRMERARDIPELYQILVHDVRRLTGFDRVVIYGFDPAAHGTVLAESRNDALPSYLDLRFPATDIPERARALALISPVRMVPDCDSAAVPVVSAAASNGDPLDLSLATLRSISPVHREYMRTMGTRASMSASIIRGSALWGLIVGHSRAPHSVPFEVRNIVGMIAQVFSLQLASREQARKFEHQAEGRAGVSQLLGDMAQARDYVEGLTATGDSLLHLTASQGVAIVSGGRCETLGKCPSGPEIQALVEWLAISEADSLISFDHLAARYPPAHAWAACGAGILAAWISPANQSCLIWFRPEAIQTVNWAGNPSEPAALPGAPTRSRSDFTLWRETVRERSLPWDQRHREAAGELRSAILEVVLGQANKLEIIFSELARLHRELETFAYSIAHDVHGPLLRVIAFAEMLDELPRERLDGEERGWVDRLRKNAQHSSALLGHLLGFTEIGRIALRHQEIDVEDMFDMIYEELAPRYAPVQFEWKRGRLPRVEADPALLKIALGQLVENALKFSAAQPAPCIEIGGTQNDSEHVLYVKDNGRGFAMAEAERIFSVFERMQRTTEEEGIGVGLAIARRVIARHGGRIWATAEPGQGATFSVALPRVPRGELDVIRQQIALQLENRPAG